jgi:hypothetical protein
MQRKMMLALATLVVAAGCTSGTGKGLSVSAAVVTTAASDTNTVASGNVIDAGNGILITRIRLVVATAEVEGSPACPNAVVPAPTALLPVLGRHGSDGSGRHGGTCRCDGFEEDESGDDDCRDDDASECEIEGGPYLVDLSGADLTGSVHPVAGLEVPAGTYDEVEFKIKTINARKAGSDAGLQDMAAAHASTLVDGTMDGVAFTFRTAMALKQERTGAIVVDEATGGNVTLEFDASGWFKAADGSKLDPTDPTARGAILANIRASIRVLSDRDCDGWDDDDVRPPYDPCAWKACGAWCRACAPWDKHCAETAVLKVCDPAGACVIQGTPFVCPGLPDPCAGLACGSECTISLPCHLATPPCEAPQQLGHCDLSGQCLPGDATTCQPSADCAGKACGASCNPCGTDQPCPTLFAATACDPWGRCVTALPGLCACVDKACGESCDPCDGLCSHPYASTCEGTGHCRPVGYGVACSP